MENKPNKRVRTLKYGEWSYDFDTNELHLFVVDRDDPQKYERLTMNKTYAFSLARFLISVWQKLSVTRRPRPKKAK